MRTATPRERPEGARPRRDRRGRADDPPRARDERHSPRAHGRRDERFDRPPAGHAPRVRRAEGRLVRCARRQLERPPSSTTSCSSSTPYCSRARRRASAISARQSAVVAPPAFSMKFACFGEISAPPMRYPLSPHSSSILPAPSSPGGFLKTRAERALRRRLRRLARVRRARAPRARISAGSLGVEPVLDRGDDLAGADARVAVREAELGRRQPAAAVGGRDERAHDDRAPVAAVRARVHPHAAAGRAGDRAGELEAAEPGVAGAVEADGVRRAAARDEQSCPRPAPRRARPSSRSTSASTPASAASRFEPRPTVATVEAALARLARAPAPARRACAAGVGARRPAGADRRQPRERDAFLDDRAARRSSRQPVHDRPRDLPRLPHAERDHEVARAAPRRARASRRRRATGAQPARTCARQRVDARACRVTPSRGRVARAGDLRHDRGVGERRAPRRARRGAGACARRRAAGRRRSAGPPSSSRAVCSVTSSSVGLWP